jgi:hypothetical protein
MRRIITFLALGSVVACDFIRDPTTFTFDREYVTVHSVLRAGSDTATVFLSRVAGPEQLFELTLPVSGATVRLSTGGTAAELREAEDASACIRQSSDSNESGGGCYTAVLTQPVTPGATYELMVEVPDGATITGSTTVPHPVPLRAEPQHATLVTTLEPPGGQASSSVSLEWEPQPAGAPLTLSIALADASCLVTLNGLSGDEHSVLDVTSLSAADLSARHLFCPEQRVGTHSGHVVLTHYDDNFRSVLERTAHGDMVPPEDVTFGVNNGAGIFASAATSVVPVTVVQR